MLFERVSVCTCEAIHFILIEIALRSYRLVTQRRICGTQSVKCVRNRQSNPKHFGYFDHKRCLCVCIECLSERYLKCANSNNRFSIAQWVPNGIVSGASAAIVNPFDHFTMLYGAFRWLPLSNTWALIANLHFKCLLLQVAVCLQANKIHLMRVVTEIT